MFNLNNDNSTCLNLSQSSPTDIKGTSESNPPDTLFVYTSPPTSQSKVLSLTRKERESLFPASEANTADLNRNILILSKPEDVVVCRPLSEVLGGIKGYHVD